MTTTVDREQSTAIPMTQGILALIHHVLLTRALHINWQTAMLHCGQEAPESWEPLCRHEFFSQLSGLATREGVPLNEQSYRAIIGLNLEDGVIQEMSQTCPEDLPSRFVFDPWQGLGKGGVARLAGAVEPVDGAGGTSGEKGTPRAVELAYRGEIRDWQVMDDISAAEGDTLAALNLEASPEAVPYKVEVRRCGHQCFLVVSRFEVEVATVILEIDRGVPTLHIGDGDMNNLHMHFAHAGVVMTCDGPQPKLKPAPADRYSYGGPDTWLVSLQHSDLARQREAVFDHLLSEYDFGGAVLDSSYTISTECVADELARWTLRLDVEEAGNERRVVFKVRFLVGTGIPCDVVALDLDTGAEVGGFPQR